MGHNNLPTAGETLATLKLLYPFIDTLLTKTNDSAFDTWKNTPVRRLEQLENEIKSHLAENPELQNHLTDNEKYSPISGIRKTFTEYTYAVDDNRIEYLRNALINGSCGDYTLELREDLYRIALEVQPLDIQILKYLVSICPSQTDFFESIEKESELKKAFVEKQEEARVLESKGEISKDEFSKRSEEYSQLSRKAEKAHAEIEKNLSFSAIQDNFSEFPKWVIYRSLDRLQVTGLIYNDGANRFGSYNPYLGFVPLDFAPVFLNFISDPRNSSKDVLSKA